MEDVNPVFNAPRNEYQPLVNGTFISSRKSSFIKNTDQGSLFSMTESNEEDADIFKEILTKPTKTVSKKKTCKQLQKDETIKENIDVIDSLDADVNSTAENVFREDLLNNNTASDIEEVAASCAINKNIVNHPEGQFIDKSISLAVNLLDSGYNSFSDEKSVSSSILFPFEKELSVSREDEHVHNSRLLTKEVLASVERFLSHSPPSLSGLSDLEYEIFTDSSLKSLRSPSYTEYSQNDESTCLMSLSAIKSQQNVELNPAKFMTNPSEKSCPNDITNKGKDTCKEPNFSGHDEVISKENQIETTNHTKLNIGPLKYSGEEENHVDNNDLSMLFTDQDESILLFEDTNAEVSDVNHSPLKIKCESSEKTTLSEIPVASHFFISDDLLTDNNSESQDQIIANANSWKPHENLECVPDEKLKSDENAFDCSQDLFSVNFDLGFCSLGSDDELIEHTPDKNKNTSLSDQPERCLGIKDISGAICTSNPAVVSQNDVDSSLSRTITSPSSDNKQNPAFACFHLSAANNKKSVSPGYSQFSLPVGKRVMSTPLHELNTLNSFSKERKEKPKMLGSSKRKINTQSVKETLNSTGDDLGPFLEKTVCREQINMRSSCHSAEGKILFFKFM